MKILLNGQSLLGRRSGIGQYTAALSRALFRLEDVEQVGLALTRSVVVYSEQPMCGEQRRTGIGWTLLKRTVGRLPGSRWLRQQLATAQLRRFQGAWTLLHEPNFVAPRLKLPLVTTVHDLGYLHCPQFMPNDRVRWLRSKLAGTLRRSSAVVADSEFIRGALLEQFPWLPSDRVFTAPLGVDRERFRPAGEPGGRPDVLCTYNLPKHFALYVGTLEPRKNLQGLLVAFNRLPLDLQQACPLVLAGMDGWLDRYFAGQLRQLVQRGVVHRIGYVPDAHVPLLMQAASFFCFPSFYEGFGLPPLEAAACGTPVLCSRAASLPEVMGSAAWYVDPHSVDDITDGLERLMSNASLRAQLSRCGLQQAAEFSWESCARATRKAYQAAA